TPHPDHPGARRAVRWRGRPHPRDLECAPESAQARTTKGRGRGGGALSTYAATVERVLRSRLLEPKSIGALGIVLGILAFWLAAPPIQARSLTWPLVVGILEALCGIFAATRGALKVGWDAVAAAMIGVGLAELATGSIGANLIQVWN